jgi:hypothetical protein
MFCHLQEKDSAVGTLSIHDAFVRFPLEPLLPQG